MKFLREQHATLQTGPPGANTDKFTVSSNGCIINMLERLKTREERTQRLGDVPTDADPFWGCLAYLLVLESCMVWET